MAERVPLLEAEALGGSKASACALNNSACFLSEGKTSAAKSQITVQRKLLAACILCFIFMIIEVIGGYMARSVAIMSDAAHMLSDVAGLGVSLFAAWAVTRRSHVSYSFGYHRAEIIGALLSILVIWAVTGALLWEAVQRILQPELVDGKLMFILAVAGIFFNLIVGSVLGHSHGHGDHGCGGHGHDHGEAKPKKQLAHAGDSSNDVEKGNCHDHDHDHDHDHAAHSHGPAGSHAPHDHAHEDHGACGHDHAHADHDHADADHDHAHGAAGHAHEDHDACGHDHAHEDHDHAHGEHEHEHGEHDHGHGDNINLRSAMLHVMGDLVQSAGVALAGLLIWFHQDDPRWHIADPICTFVFAIIVLMTTVTIVRDIMHTLMERAPPSVDMERLLQTMHEIDGVQDVHDLHVWNLSSGVEPILTAHVHVVAGVSADAVLKRLESHVRQLGIKHSTIQICNAESGSE